MLSKTGRQAGFSLELTVLFRQNVRSTGPSLSEETIVRLKPGQKIVMIGDSITDAGRRETDPPYGAGYVAMVRNVITALHPELDLTWENRGIGGNTVRDLADRWVGDVLDERPDVLAVMIGINDVWRRFGDRPLEAVPADEYQSTLVTLLRSMQQRGASDLYVGSPYIIEADRSEPMRVAMDLYGMLAREVAEEVGAVWIDVQAAFDRVLGCSDSIDWSRDRIHPNGSGHAVIALEFLRAFGVEIDG
jgi:lysophospholipase L1-like esterase